MNQRPLILLSILLSLTLPACTGTRLPESRNAEHYLREGESMFDRGLFEEAITNWEKVRDSYYSPELNIIAEMKIAEAYYRSEMYPESTAAYEDFLKQHPNHKRVPDAMYNLGLAYYAQVLAPDRDQTATRNAMVTFREFAKRYPNDRGRTEQAKVFADRCEDRLAQHELVVGRYYLNRDNYPAAINRFKSIFVKYPNFYERDEAWYLLGRTYLLNGQKEQAVEAFNTLYKQFPVSRFILDAQKTMEKYY